MEEAGDFDVDGNSDGEDLSKTLGCLVAGGEVEGLGA